MPLLSNYPDDENVSMQDRLFGTDNETGKAKNFLLERVLALLNSSAGKDYIQYKFVPGSFISPGSFSSDKANPTEITKLFLNKSSTTKDLTLLLTKLDTLQNIVISFRNPSDANNFAELKVTNITNRTEYFELDVALFKGFYSGNLIPESFYSLYFNIKENFDDKTDKDGFSGTAKDLYDDIQTRQLKAIGKSLILDTLIDKISDLNKRTSIVNADYAADVLDRTIVTTVTLTAPRIVTLNELVPIETEVIVADDFQAINGVNFLSIKAPLGKKLNGVVNGTETIRVDGGWRRFLSDGNGNYSFDAGIIRQNSVEFTNKLETGGYVGTAEALRQLIVSATTGVTGTSIVPTSPAPGGSGVASWIALEAGIYTNFGGMVVNANSIAVISRSASNVFSITQTVFDVSSKVNVSDVINTLVSTETTKPLSANQGRVLDLKIAQGIPNWTAKAYLLGDEVNHLGRDWVANAATITTDVPGTNVKWTERLNAYSLKDNNPYGYYGTYASLSAANAAIPSGIRKGKTVGIDTLDGVKEYSWAKGITDVDLILKDNDSINFLEKRDWIKDYVLTTTVTSLYFKSAINAIVDVWAEFPDGKPTIWDNNSWDLLVGFVGTVGTPTNSNRLILYYVDNTGLAVEGTNIFTFNFGSAFSLVAPVEISKTVTIESKQVIIKAFVDWRKVVAGTNGISFNLGVGLLARVFKVVKKEKPTFVSAINYDAFRTLQTAKDNNQDSNISLINSSLGIVNIPAGTNIVAGVTVVWNEWGFYNGSNVLQVKDSSWGWKYLIQYIPIYANKNITVNTSLNDGAPILLYDKDYNFIRSVGSGTGTTNVTTVTFTTAENEVFLRCSGRNPFTLSIIINEEVQAEATKITNLENAVEKLEADVEGLGAIVKTAIPTIIMPTKVFTTCNDVNRTTGWTENIRGYSVDVYLDRFILLTAKKDAYFKNSKRQNKTLASRIYRNPEPLDGVTFMQWNDELDISEKTITLDITGADTIDASVSFTHVSSLSSLSRLKFPKILQIGDSVTEGSEAHVNGNADKPEVSWQWVKYFFELDKIEGGNVANDYSALVMGTRIKRDFTVTLNGTTNNIRTACEGRSGWRVIDYLTLENYNSRPNSFYDVDKVGTNKFSLSKYLSRHKTLDDNGTTRLTLGTTSGTLVTNVNDYDVCTPNIVIIQLGFNDSEVDYVSNLTAMINRIKEEYPSMIIGLSQIDVSGTYFPDSFPEWDSAQSDINILTQVYLKRLHEKMTRVFNAVKALENETNRIFIIPSGFIQPTADSMGYRLVNEASYLSELNNKLIKKQIFASSAIGYHPNNYAHACWGYEVYSWVKWLCAKNYI